MKFAESTVDLRSEKSIRDYLEGHFRYDTMSSWNRSTSFAHNIKIRNLELQRDPRIQTFDAKHGNGAAMDAAYQLIGLDDVWSEIGASAVDEFTSSMNGAYTIGSNGRSGGYLVLYLSSYKESEYKSQCQSCYQKNYQKVPDGTQGLTANKCGCCGAEGDHGRRNFDKPLVSLEVRSGHEIGTDLDEYSFSELKSLARVVMAFDATVREIRDNFIQMILDYQVQEEVIMVPKKVMVLAPRVEVSSND